MKYKPGDKIKIKEWREIGQLYKSDPIGTIYAYNFPSLIKENFDNKFPDRVVTIKRVECNHYIMEETNFGVVENMIEYKIKVKKYRPIYNRFEILDL